MLRTRWQAAVMLSALTLITMQASATGFKESSELRSQPTHDVITLDGRLDEPAWQHVAVIDDFQQVEPVQGAAPSEATRVRLLHDDQHFYIGIEVTQRAAPIIAKQMIQQRDIEGDDQISVFIDPLRTGRIGYVFRSNPNGVRNQALIVNSDDLDDDWEDIWQVATLRSVDGWTAEFAIPFKTLAFRAGAHTWAINISRRIAAANEDIALASAGRRIDLTTTRAVAGFANIKPSRGLDVVTSVSARRQRDFEDDIVANRLEPSLDVFYQLTPALTAALTLNTDFSAAEVDQREVNLTRFDLFFPEKRDFFLQDANLFEFADLEENGLPYFSRRIGVDEDGDPLDVNGGIKLSGRVGEVSVGALLVEQDLRNSADSARLAVARARADIGERHAFGGIATRGDPLTGRDDQLVGLDYAYQNDDLLGDQEVEAFAWWQQVDLHEAGPADQAWGASLAWPNDRIDARAAYTVIEDDFAPPLGFVNRVGIRQFDLELARRWRPRGSVIRTLDVGLDGHVVEDSAGWLATRVVELSPLNVRNQSGDEFEIALIDNYERLEDEFEITDAVAITAGRYDFRRYAMELRTARQRRWAVEAKLEAGDFYSGRLTTLESSLLLTPTPRLNLRFDYEHNRLTDIVGEDGQLLGETIRLLRMSAGFAFDARWSWTQLFQYDSESRELGYNTRLRWEPRAGQELFLILNHGFVRDRFDRFQSEEREVVTKLSYVVQF